MYENNNKKKHNLRVNHNIRAVFLIHLSLLQPKYVDGKVRAQSKKQYMNITITTNVCVYIKSINYLIKKKLLAFIKISSPRNVTLAIFKIFDA